jgi:16S rRNA (guanine966-N2)-methyltransferase
MRITGGIHRSRKLETPKNDAVRPTSDKVRQAIFNMLKSRGVLDGASVLDAFCGTGALGLEALSQGAEHCIFFDNNKNSIQLCKANIFSLNEENRSDVLFQDVGIVKLRPDNINPVNLVFLDPPYRKELISKSIEALHQGHWLTEDAFFVIEAAKDETITSDFIQIVNEKKYGDTKILLATLVS